jgi:preprotein translocase subunit YajC
MKFNNGDPVRTRTGYYGRINICEDTGSVEIESGVKVRKNAIYSVFVYEMNYALFSFHQNELEKVSEEEYRANEVLSS